ncbi:hypothetical protein [Actinacidiphila acidipaludis]|uniref:SIS domain-containing protein n=1 Tax=Actinacidiphila acidipaludis TaxID=2873382 RepID=A0ABS7Q096_9ACTN|nr:hypothetical protein [Streptomyces acidipaludis]MBY8876408.1 hypothetical protein [Streptomyces acidipaludis]
MDALRVALLREALAGTEWPRTTRAFGGALRRAVRRRGGGLLLVGTAAYEPWHLAAHLDEEAAWSGVPELAPTLVRHRVPPGARPHLSVGLARLAAAGRADTLLVVAPAPLGGTFLERLDRARRDGATLLAVDATGTSDLRGLAHDALAVPEDPLIPLDTVQHLIAAGAAAPAGPSRRSPRARLAARLMTPPRRW